MKPLILVFTCLASSVSAQWPPQPQPGAPLNFQQSMAQAKDELKHFLARDKPVTDSISNIQEYYVGIKERNMRNLRPRRQLRRPCKVLPDPQPALVNTRLVAPTQRFHPLRRNEEYFGEFAPPVTLSGQALADTEHFGDRRAVYANNANAGVGRPVYDNYGPRPVYDNFNPRPVYDNYGQRPVYDNYNPRPNYPVVANPGPNPVAYQNAYQNQAQNPFQVQNNLIPPQQHIVQVPMFMTQKETVYLNPTPPVENNYGDPYHHEAGGFLNVQPTPTSKQNGFMAGLGNWMMPTATPTMTNVNTAALMASLSAMQSSMSAQSASLSSASAMAYFSSIAASLSAREASLSAQMTATAHNYYDNGYYGQRRR